MQGQKYGVAGIGIGKVLTEIEQGRTQWRAAFQLSYGLFIPISERIIFNLKFKFVLARDIDNLVQTKGWYVDTSGRWHPFRFGPHWDTNITFYKWA